VSARGVGVPTYGRAITRPTVRDGEIPRATRHCTTHPPNRAVRRDLKDRIDVDNPRRLSYRRSSMIAVPDAGLLPITRPVCATKGFRCAARPDRRAGVSSK
jgi:hypothetical protein